MRDPFRKFSPVTRKILNSAPVDLQTIADNMTEWSRQDIAGELETIATFASFAASYLSQRAGAGCGDQGHKSSLRKANRVRGGLRKLFGYHVTPSIEV